jgi:prepilin-type N-terminal cleavage/methylation domain-containing protein
MVRTKKRFREGDRGFTITELLVASTVLAVFIMLALGSIVPSYQVTREADESLSSQREVVMAFDRLVAEMSVLDRASASAAADSLAFLSDQEFRGSNLEIADVDLDDLGVANPNRIWRKFVILHRRDNALWRREYPYTKGPALCQIVSDKIPILAQVPGRQEKIFSKNIELFEAVPAGRTRILLKIRSVFRQGSKPAACELNLQIQMRGGN